MSAYEKHTWVKDEEITADKLNNLETGVAAACRNKVLPEKTLSGWSAYGNGTHVFTGKVENIGAMIPGETYVVSWDDKAYVCECYTNIGMVTCESILGNAKLFNSLQEDTEEPFLIMVTTDGVLIFADDDLNSHLVAIDRAQTVHVDQLKVTADDEGKFLSVVNGKPAWVSLS